jgi:serine/threonine-protein phosphatase 2A regulatory subunit A
VAKLTQIFTAKLNDMDQVLLAMAKKLGDIVPFIGGPDYAHLLVTLLEALCSSEETVVRTAAGLSASKILKQIDPGANSSSAQAYFGLLKRLTGTAGGDENDVFYAKVSACLFIDEVYRVMVNPDDRTAVQEIYLALCRDEMPIVRRGAAQAFTRLMTVASPEVQSTDFLELLKGMSGVDEHQTVRILAVQSYVPYCQLLHKNNTIVNCTEEVFGLIKAAVDDPSWRVRLAIVKNFGAFATCFPPELVSAEVFTSYVHLLQDSEADVRSAACESGLPFLDVVGPDVFLADVVPIAVQLSADVTPCKFCYALNCFACIICLTFDDLSCCVSLPVLQLCGSLWQTCVWMWLLRWDQRQSLST